MAESEEHRGNKMFSTRSFLLTAAVCAAAPAPAYAATYTGYFNVLVTSGGRFDTTRDELGDPIRTYTSYVGRRMALRWSSATSFNVQSPVFPFEIRPTFTVNSASVGEVALADLFSADFDGFAFRSATFSGNQEAGSFFALYNSNDALDESISFSYSSGSSSASGFGEAILYDDSQDEFGASFKFDIVGGRAFAAVPEPLTWSMMVMGFGVCGAAARFRSRSAPQPA